MHPEGDQHPKEITHTHKIYSKQLDNVSTFSDSMTDTGKLLQSLIVLGKKECW